MASESIPRLDELSEFSLCRLERSALEKLERQAPMRNVPPDFVEEWAKIHDQNWGFAEDHWERMVAEVLDTDAVSQHVSGSEAIRQAVTATLILLTHPQVSGYCPECWEEERK